MSCDEDNNVVTLRRSDSTSCKIHLFGATLINWTCENDNYIFLSSKALFNGKSGIRGGIPIVFPNFGPWSDGPQHGFARISWWTIEKEPTSDEQGNVLASFCLEDNDNTRAMWPHRFKLILTIELLEKSLKMSFKVLNTDISDFLFTCLLHTYFDVPDVKCASVSGLLNSELNDKINGIKETVEKDDLLFNGLTDSIYHKTPSVHRIHRMPFSNSIEIRKETFSDTVIWNPWQEKSSAMADMGEGDWTRMLCVEVGQVVEPIKLKSGGCFCASQTMEIIQPTTKSKV